jgi:hypothetical protein
MDKRTLGRAFSNEIIQGGGAARGNLPILALRCQSQQGDHQLNVVCAKVGRSSYLSCSVVACFWC